MTPQQRKARAEKILYEMGLHARLAEIGKPHVIGSCRMDMMAWNALDIDIENPNMSREKLYDLTAYILKTFSPSWRAWTSTAPCLSRISKPRKTSSLTTSNRKTGYKMKGLRIAIRSPLTMQL